jgi:hypothetical protein
VGRELRAAFKRRIPAPDLEFRAFKRFSDRESYKEKSPTSGGIWAMALLITILFSITYKMMAEREGFEPSIEL